MKIRHDGAPHLRHAECQECRSTRPGLCIVSFSYSLDPAKPTANGTIRQPADTADDPDAATGSSPARTTYAQLARWLMVTEVHADAHPVEVWVAANRVCLKLSVRLARLVSPGGAQAIWARALHLARREFPFLTGVRADPDACFDGLAEHLRGVEPAAADAALQAVLGRVLDLLVGFIGEDLTLHLVREVWPDMPLLVPGRPGDADDHEAAP